MRAEPDSQVPVPAGGDLPGRPVRQQVLHGLLRVHMPVRLRAESTDVRRSVCGERGVDLSGVFPLEPVPALGAGVSEEDGADVVAVDHERPLAGVCAAVGGAGAAVVVQARAVVALPVDLDAVVLDGAPLHLEEVIDEVLSGGKPDPAGSGDPAFEHLRR